jgi:MarR family transcriptional regulator for hemolysin
MDNAYVLEESFGYLTGHTYRAINRRLKQLFESEGHPLTVEQFGVLVHLWERDGRCQNEIADILDKDKPSISRLLKHLEEKDLLERKSDDNDSRKKQIFLTEAGRNLESCSKNLALQVYKECIESLSTEEIKTTKKILVSIKNNLT